MKPSLRKLKLRYPHKAFYKVPYLLPPWGDEQIRLFWNYFLNKENCTIDSFEDEIKRKLRHNFNISFLDSGRHAIKVLLKILSFPFKSEIIIPVLSCNVIPETIIECGFIPSFADVGNDLCLTVESIKRSMSSKTKGVMLVHAGGAVANEYKEIIEFCNTNGLYLIDNAAQGWGNEMDGIWLGGRGDAGIISFGLGKSTFGIGGGILISNSSAIIKKIDDRKIYNRVTLMKFYLQYLKRSYTAPLFMCLNNCLTITGNDEVKQISYLDRALQYSIFIRIKRLIEERTEISLSIRSILHNSPILFPQEKNKHVWTKLIVKLPERLRIMLQKYLYMKRIETEDYHQPHYLNSYWKGRAKLSEAGYPSAGKIYKELLVLPNSPRLDSSQLNYLYKAIEEFKRKYL